jgi:hypothetical protein
MIQNFKENPNINFISQLDLWFSDKMLKSTKIALMVVLMVVLQITTKLPGIDLSIHQIPC